MFILFEWIRNIHYARLRDIDKGELWQSIVIRAATPLGARKAMTVHCYRSKAWLALSDDEIEAEIDRMVSDAFDH